MMQPYRNSNKPDELMVEIQTTDVYVKVKLDEYGRCSYSFTFYGDPKVISEYMGRKNNPDKGEDQPLTIAKYVLRKESNEGTLKFNSWFKLYRDQNLINIPGQETGLILPVHKIYSIEFKEIERVEKVYYTNPDNLECKF